MANRADTEKIFGKTLNPDGTLRAVSPSQYTSFTRCGLRWHFEKKGKLAKKPMGKGAAIGDAAHDRLKTFLKTGQDVRGSLELVGAKMLEPYLWAAPFKKGPGLVEDPLLEPRLSTPGGILITGYFDFYIPGLNGHEGTGMEWPIVIDHKFKKDLIKWGYYIGEDAVRLLPKAQAEWRSEKDEEKLKDDPQTVTYGAWALARQPEADGVIVRQHQHQTEGEGGRFQLPAEVRLTRDDLLRRWAAMGKVIDGPMAAAAKIPPALPGQTPEGVPFNVEACGDFGGCDFARTCKHSPMNRFTALLRPDAPAVSSKLETTPYTEVNPMGLLGQITNPGAASATTPNTQGAMVAAVATVQAASSAPAPSTATGPASVGHPEIPFMTELAVDKLKPGVVYLIQGGPARFEGQLGSRVIFRAKDGGLRELGTDAKARTVDEETLCLFEGRPFQKPQPTNAGPVENKAPADAPAQLDAAKEEKKRKLGIVDVVEGAGTGVTPPDVNTKPVTPPPAEPKPQPEASVSVSTAEATAGTAAEVKAEIAAEQSKPAGKKRGPKAKPEGAEVSIPAPPTGEAVGEDGSPKLMLLINCSCNRARDLAPYVKKIADDVAAKHGAPDVRLGHKQSDLGFGGWRGLMAIEAAKAPPSGLCSITSGELADPVIEALVPLATVVVRGGVL